MFRHTPSGGRLPAIAAIAVAGALFAAAPAAADTENGNHPGETSISVGISTHAATVPAGRLILDTVVVTSYY